MDSLDDHLNSLRLEWNTLKEKWFHGESLDPVFEGVVRDFCAFDDAMHQIYEKVGQFMKGVENLSDSLIVLSDGVSAGLAHTNDHVIASDSCKMREVTNQIARADAPNSAVAKLRRDMHYNILAPMQSHITNNRNLKLSLDVRRHRLLELNGTRKQYDDCVKKGLSNTDKRFLQAQSNLESAKLTFNDIDKNVFEWLYILEEYRGDVLDSTQQTLKYLQYEFFASAAHAISGALPARMEFRPMVEMTPEHLEAQVEMELEESEENESSPALDFSQRLIEKKTREEPENDAGPALPVDPLSLSSLLSQGFEEGPARRALRIHRNDTQQALDWLINASAEDMSKTQTVSDGVRMPTTVKRAQKYKAARKARQEKLRGGGDSSKGNSQGPNEGRSRTANDDSPPQTSTEVVSAVSETPKQAPPPLPPDDLLNIEAQPATESESTANVDLLSFSTGETSVPTDFSGPVDLTPLPPSMDLFTDTPTTLNSQSSFTKSAPGDPLQDLFSISEMQASVKQGAAASVTEPEKSSAEPYLEGVPPELQSMVKALAAQSNVSPQQLLLTAQQLAQGPILT